MSSNFDKSHCPSCLDGAHGDCVLWGYPAHPCVCSCEKRCGTHHPSKRLNHISCSLAFGHGGDHTGLTPFTATPSPWQECLCGYMGSPGHRCNLTMASLRFVIEDANGGRVEFVTEPDREPVEVGWQIMTELRKLKRPVTA